MLLLSSCLKILQKGTPHFMALDRARKAEKGPSRIQKARIELEKEFKQKSCQDDISMTDAQIQAQDDADNAA